MEKRDKNGLTEAEFLAQYNVNDYKPMFVAVDILVLKMKEDLSGLQALLIKRDEHPYIFDWALPGGFVREEESTYEAACRELQEEAGLTNIHLKQVYAMSRHNRDPRTRVVSISYLALLPYGEEPAIAAGDEASDIDWFDVKFNKDGLTLTNDGLGVKIEYALTEKTFKNGTTNTKSCDIPRLISDKKLAFDHSEIVLEALTQLREQVMYTDVAFNLSPTELTLPDLQRIYEVILDKDLYKANFREKVEHKIKKLDKKGKPLTSPRTSQLYVYNGV